MSKIKIMSYDDVFESETDLEGNIISCNDKFLDMIHGTRAMVIGKPHNIIKHPKMPSVVFVDMWKNITMGESWQGIVLNICLNNTYTYWMNTTITPKFNEQNEIIAYKAVRRQATPEEILNTKRKYNL